MPLKNGRITPAEKIVTRVYARTGDLVYAADKAGIAVTSAHRIVNRPTPKQMIAELREKMLAEGVPEVVNALKKIALDENHAPAPRVGASREYLRASGMYTGEPGKEADPDEQSTADLLTKAQQAMDEANRIGRLMIDAKVVEEVSPGGVFD